MVKFQPPNYDTFRDLNYFLRLLVKSRLQTESGAYEPTMQKAQVGSKIQWVGGLKKIAILRVGGPKFFCDSMGGWHCQTPKHNSVWQKFSRWFEKLCDSVGGWMGGKKLRFCG